MLLKDNFERFLSLDTQFYTTLRRLRNARPEQQTELLHEMYQILDELESLSSGTSDERVALLADLDNQRWH